MYLLIMRSIDERLLHSLYRVYGSLVDELVNRLYTPSRRLYVRVNTLLIDRGELIDRFRERGLIAYPDPYIDDAIYFHIKGPYNIPLLDKRIYVDRYAAESIMMGANLYAPGITGFTEFRVGNEVSVVAPNGSVVAIVEAKVSSNELKNMENGLVGVNLVSLYRAPPIRDLEEYDMGLFYPQSLPAMIVSHLVDPKPGELIVDMNAAPGGKTSHLIQLSHGSSRIIAFERSVKKALTVVDTLSRLKLLYNVVILPMDSRYIDIDLNLIGKVDKVLIDPPCTGLGVRPKIHIDKSYRDVVVASEYQYQFVKTAYRIIRRNGLIVYSTCTVTFEENEGVSLRAIRELELEPVDHGFLPYSERVELGDLVAYRYSPLYYDMPGYYIVLFKKV